MAVRIETRVRELERELASLKRDMRMGNQRTAAPLMPRLGRHFVELNEALLPQEEAEAHLVVWNDGVLDERDATTITIRDFQLQPGQTLAAGTRLWAVWDKTTWTWIASNEASSLGIPFINLSDETVPAGGIMDWYGDTNIDGTRHVRCFKPGVSFSRRWLVNGATPIAQGDTGLGSWLDDLSGGAAIDPYANPLLGPHTGWGPLPGSWFLYSTGYGFTLVGSQTVLINGTLNAHFRQEEVKHLKVRLTENVTRTSFAFATILFRNTFAEMVPSPFSSEITVRDGGYLRPGEFIAASPSSPIVADVEWMGSFWEITNAQCEPQEEDAASTYTPGGGSMAIHQFAPPSSPAFPSMA